MKSSEIKTLLNKHNRLASEALNIGYDTGNMPLKRYKDLIDSDETIREIIKEIVNKSKDAEELFVVTQHSLSTNEATDEVENLAILYKEITKLVVEDVNLTNYAIKYFALKYRKYNDMLNELMSICLLPLVKYIREALTQKIYELEEKEKAQSFVIHGDYVGGNQQKNNDKAVMKTKNVDKRKFVFSKENFFLGVLSAVVVEVVAWGIIELIKSII